MIVSIAVVIICLIAGNAVCNSIRTAQLQECLKAKANATCGSPVFEILEEYSEEPSEENAHRAVELVSAMYLASSGKLNRSLLAVTDTRLAALEGFVNDENARCVISESRSFALAHLNLSIGRDVVSAFDAASGLDKPVTSFAVGIVDPGVINFIFNITDVDLLNRWLESGLITTQEGGCHEVAVN